MKEEQSKEVARPIQEQILKLFAIHLECAFSASSSDSTGSVPNLLIILMLSVVVFAASGASSSDSGGSSSTAFHSITVPTLATFTTKPALRRRRRVGGRRRSYDASENAASGASEAENGDVPDAAASDPLFIPLADDLQTSCNSRISTEEEDGSRTGEDFR